MLGSILSNLLLVLGCCFIVGGLRYHEQSFNVTITQAMSSMMFMATSALILPAAFQATQPTSKHTDVEILQLSRGTAVVLLIIYGLFLLFQLKTHADLYGDIEEETPPTPTLSAIASSVVLLFVTVAVAWCAEYLVGSIDAIVQETSISKTFIGLVSCSR
jgi:Ca2+:H+ antiporter